MPPLGRVRRSKRTQWRKWTNKLLSNDLSSTRLVGPGTAEVTVVLYILHTLIPVADIYANVPASAIWDRVKSALARQN